MADESSLRRMVSLILLLGVAFSGTMVVAGLLFRFPGLVETGVLTLIATPVLRVLVLGAGFAKARQWRLAGLCGGLFLLLAAGFFFGKR